MGNEGLVFRVIREEHDTIRNAGLWGIHGDRTRLVPIKSESVSDRFRVNPIISGRLKRHSNRQQRGNADYLHFLHDWPLRNFLKQAESAPGGKTH